MQLPRIVYFFSCEDMSRDVRAVCMNYELHRHIRNKAVWLGGPVKAACSRLEEEYRSGSQLSRESDGSRKGVFWFSVDT